MRQMCKCPQVTFPVTYPLPNFSVFICQTAITVFLSMFYNLSAVSLCLFCYSTQRLPNNSLHSFPSSLTSLYAVHFSYNDRLLPSPSPPPPSPSLSFPVRLLRPRRSFAGSWRRKRLPVCTAYWETYWGTISTTTGHGSCRADAVPEPCAPKPCCTSTTRSSSSASTALSSRSKSTQCR